MEIQYDVREGEGQVFARIYSIRPKSFNTITCIFLLLPCVITAVIETGQYDEKNHKI